MDDNEKTAILNVEVKEKLLAEFDIWLKQNLYSNRSEAIRDIMRKAINSKSFLPSKPLTDIPA